MSFDELAGSLKERGLRMTPQRMEMLQLLQTLSHPTAEQLYAKMRERFPFVSQATVYNTLKTLKELGIVRELESGLRIHRYEVAGERHCHFVCNVCGEVFDLDAETPEWSRHLPARHGDFQIEECRMELSGICPGCQERVQPGQTPPAAEAEGGKVNFMPGRKRGL